MRFLFGLGRVSSTLAFSLALTSASFSCGTAASGAGAEVTGTTGEAIIDGTNSTSAQDSVVLIQQPLGGGSEIDCSGVLLAPTLVMTARHCISNLPDEGFTCNESGVGSAGGDIISDLDPSSLLIYTGAARETSPSQARARGAQFFHDDATNICNHDIALILLDTAIDDVPIAQIRLTTGPTANESIAAVGWGVTTTTETPGTRQQRTVSIERIGPSRDSAHELDVPPNEFEVGESICEGDSGGPAFDSTTGAVVGIVSRGGNAMQPVEGDLAAVCVGASNFYSEPYQHQDIINQGYAAAGQAPWIEGQGDPRLTKPGAACTQSSACQTSLCADVNGAMICTYDCASAACPSGFACEASDGGGKYCLASPSSGSSGSSKGGCAIATNGPAAPGTGKSSSSSGVLVVGVAAIGLMTRGRRRRRRGAAVSRR